MITQFEMARQLGVSQQAVSFALNGTGTLKEETRQRILEEAKRLGYRRSAAARAMQTGRTGAIGLLSFGHAKSRLPPALLSGVSTLLDEENHSLSMVNISPKQLTGEAEPPLPFREHRIDGCVVLIDEAQEGRLPELLRSTRMPAIWANRKQPQNAAYPDDFHLGETAVRILLARGYQRICYAGPSDTDAHYSRQDRYLGYLSAMAEAGLKPRKVGPSGNRDISPEHCRKVLCAARRPEAFICYGSQDADTLWLEAAKLGLSVPEDVGLLVIGEAGAHIGYRFYSLLRVPLFYVGKKAVELLRKRIASGGKDVASVAIRGEQFDEGSTLRPPPSR